MQGYVRLMQAGLIVLVVAFSARVFAVPVTYDGITFPDGDVSFADEVLDYDPSYSGEAVPTDPNYMDPTEALGAPDYSAPYGSVSLGSGGLIELAFTDNALTNSGDDAYDLHIFEVGPDIEDTFVAIRPTLDTLDLLGSGYDSNGDGFFEVGSVTGSTSSLDIDAIFSGFTAGSLLFDAVQLIDDPDKDGQGGGTVGADIDAVGAIYSAPPEPEKPPVASVPEPGTIGLLSIGLLALGLARRRNPG
ncbi:PEP-CTERM sorting domain-containing protein [Marinobacter sp.]|uniref:PEP-CTERM sorting domain-containing protein n=1 Tax=Marinobacter sp. TaxID=50741 RepID=UPI003568EAC0